MEGPPEAPQALLGPLVMPPQGLATPHLYHPQ